MPFNPFVADFKLVCAAVEDEPLLTGKVLRFLADDIANFNVVTHSALVPKSNAALFYFSCNRIHRQFEFSTSGYFCRRNPAGEQKVISFQ